MLFVMHADVAATFSFFFEETMWLLLTLGLSLTMGSQFKQ